MSVRGQQGFTLVEMLLVLVVLALTAGLVTSRFGARSADDNLQAIAYETASRARAARTVAMRSGIDQVVLIDLADRVVSGGDKSPLQIPTAVDIVAETSAAERPDPSVAAVRFLPNGSSTGGMVRLATGTQAYEIRISWFTGRVSVAAAR
jgi:general secretion pathway protein H